jgi:hypothetical protein
VEFESPHLHQLGCCWSRSARTAAWSTPASCWTGAAHSVLLDDDAPVPEKSWPPSQNYSVGNRTTPRGSAATSVKAPGPALPMQRGAVEHHPVQDALDTVPLVPVDHCQ